MIFEFKKTGAFLKGINGPTLGNLINPSREILRLNVSLLLPKKLNFD